MVTIAQKKSLQGQTHYTPLRYITATSLFDGHDAAINIVRRLIQDHGAEVIHLGHNRSVEEIVRAALQEDVNGIAVSSYQGGHMEFYPYLLSELQAKGAGHICVFAGGGGTITPDEASTLEKAGIAKVYLPEYGHQKGLLTMIDDLINRTRNTRAFSEQSIVTPSRYDDMAIGRVLSLIEQETEFTPTKESAIGKCPVIGITGTGGSGKSTFIDEILCHMLHDMLHDPGNKQGDRRIALLAIDPTRSRSGGALLGDRIRMNSLASPQIYMRSMATRRRHLTTNLALVKSIEFLKSLGFDLIMVETAGAGQGSAEITELVDLSLYVMTPDYGAPNQLEKIEMLDLADLIILNKSDRQGAEDALYDVRKQWRRNHAEFTLTDTELPVYATVASSYSYSGVYQAYTALCDKVESLSGQLSTNKAWRSGQQIGLTNHVTELIPTSRKRYLSEIAEHGRKQTQAIERQVDAASSAYGFYRSMQALDAPDLPAPLQHYPPELEDAVTGGNLNRLRRKYDDALNELSEEAIDLLKEWPDVRARAKATSHVYTVRGQKVTGENYSCSLSGLDIPKLALPRDEDWGAQCRFLLLENLPGVFPYTAGVYPYRRTTEDPSRMFAGEGTPERTNRRFHYLAHGQKATRLSTAFDPIVLYGEDPTQRPDIYGRLGMSGVSIATLDDIKKLYSGFDLLDPATSVSMTINGPAPILLACFMNAAIDQQVEKYLHQTGRWRETEKKIAAIFRDKARPGYHGSLPAGHTGLGLGLLGVSGVDVIEPESYARIRDDTLATVRGTVQADILKEDQAQNECIYSIDFALRMMGDIQEFFINHKVKNYYSVSVSGYHIAEAGANPVTQLAFTLANAFTLVEYYRARGMEVDDFAPNMSFFFSNGMDPEYAVLGRVARRIWSRAMRDLYQASPRSQMLKYHIQTSGRSLHAREIGFNDIRTTLQALYAIYDNCNSLHTNAYDEAVTTPTEESARRALAIQLIINRELGLNLNQNPLQGAYIIEQLTDRVEKAVYQEFERLSERGGVLGAMETLYQRNKIQEESLYYESLKDDGSLPVIGVNTFLGKETTDAESRADQLIRATVEEKEQQIEGLELFRQNHVAESAQALNRLQEVVRAGGNTFEELMQTVRCCSLGQITHALYAVGGRYRRRM